MTIADLIDLLSKADCKDDDEVLITTRGFRLYIFIIREGTPCLLKILDMKPCIPIKG
jgi:hypothetical protein